MNTASNLLVASGGGVANGDNNNNDNTITEQSGKQQLYFRGKPIEWITENKKSITQNALDTDTPDEETLANKWHFIIYDGKKYSKDLFLKATFANYRKYPYKVIFNNDDVFYLSGSQRAKLQYHILAQNFELIEVDEKDKDELQAFCNSHYAKTSKIWLQRMKWESGHEKMITFGAGLEVVKYKGEKEKLTPIKGVYCYVPTYEDNCATFEGVKMQWELWLQPIIDYLNSSLDKLIQYPIEDENRKKVWTNKRSEKAINIMRYQNGTYLTLPQLEDKKIKEWIYNYLQNGATPFPYNGIIPNADIKFTIDFQNDIEIAKQHDNTKHNQELGRERVEKTFSRLVGDEWTRAEILKQGFNKGNFDNFVKYGFIEKVVINGKPQRGRYKRNFV